jgi:hypothetical protein
MGSISDFDVVEFHEHFDVVRLKAKNMLALLSKRNFRKGEIVAHFSKAAIFDQPTYLTVQSGIHEHSSLDPGYLQYTNHSCDPTIFIDTVNLVFIALKDIHPGDEITFFYPSTEWDMDRKFTCSCGSSQCIGEIGGAKQTERGILSRYRLAPHILSQLNNLHS